MEELAEQWRIGQRSFACSIMQQNRNDRLNESSALIIFFNHPCDVRGNQTPRKVWIFKEWICAKFCFSMNILKSVFGHSHVFFKSMAFRGLKFFSNIYCEKILHRRGNFARFHTHKVSASSPTRRSTTFRFSLLHFRPRKT